MIYRNIEKNLKVYKRILSEIKNKNLSESDGEKIKEIYNTAKKRIKSGENAKLMLTDVFAAVFEAVKRTLNITPFDVQLMAAAAMASERIIELPTGEGKTLVAVFAACFGALSEKGVHVLTFNDYLAKRDALWMKPVYEFMGLTVRYINEGMSKNERREAYNADVTYITAKEAGFDYLREFLAYDEGEKVRRPFNFAIVDEADSIMIDEARIPLVIAGDMPVQIEIEKNIYSAVSKLEENTHFIIDEYDSSILLTDTGIAFIETQLQTGNIYDDKNRDILSKVNVMLQAVFLLKRDVHYIIRQGDVLLIDEFTGRIKKDCQWSDGLQAAIEVKEGLEPKPQGMVMNRITLQNFLQFYPSLCGMTGTACSAASEFYEFYDRTVTVIPPNKPCIRIDNPDIVFAGINAKLNAVAEEIIRVNKTGRPVLVGTGSIEESEQLAGILLPHIPEINVLNAKNDSEEAGIIANAGKLNTVTISTNMAGRGVDIRLGGLYGGEYSEVCSLGGLYVIGTNRYESVRINNQLRGRAGRQGDPGESRFFISIEDDLLVKYRISEYFTDKLSDPQQKEPIQSSALDSIVAHIQRVAEGQTFDAKITLSKYSSIAEDQRKIVYEKRENLLSGRETPSFIEKEVPEKFAELLTQVSEDELRFAEKAITLYAINQCWAEHLLIIEDALDEVQIVSEVRKDPFTYFNRRLIEDFDLTEKRIQDMILKIFDSIIIKNGHVDLQQMGVKGPSSTRTYMVNDGTEKQGAVSEIAAMTSPLYMFYLFAEFFKKFTKLKSKNE